MPLYDTSAWISNPDGGSKQGMVAVGGSSPGQIHIIPSCSKHGNDFILTLRNCVDGIFSHFPSVEYSHPDVYQQQSFKILLYYKTCLRYTLYIWKVEWIILTDHDMGIGCDPHLLNQGEEGMLYVHMYSGHIQVSHLFHEK